MNNKLLKTMLMINALSGIGFGILATSMYGFDLVQLISDSLIFAIALSILDVPALYVFDFVVRKTRGNNDDKKDI